MVPAHSAKVLDPQPSKYDLSFEPRCYRLRTKETVLNLEYSHRTYILLIFLIFYFYFILFLQEKKMTIDLPRLKSQNVELEQLAIMEASIE